MNDDYNELIRIQESEVLKQLYSLARTSTCIKGELYFWREGFYREIDSGCKCCDNTVYKYSIKNGRIINEKGEELLETFPNLKSELVKARIKEDLAHRRDGKLVYLYCDCNVKALEEELEGKKSNFYEGLISDLTE